MKTLRKFLLLIAVTGLQFSCSKSDQFDFGMYGESCKYPNWYPVAKEKLFIVKPGGIDDTETLSKAFDEAIKYGPRAVVQLMAGEYYLNFIEIREFNGKFRGAGKGKTIITTVAELSVDDLITQNLNTVLIRFVGGDVHMSNMTIKTPPGALSAGKIDGLVGFSALTAQYTSKDEYIKAVINNVEFTGYWENINHGLKAESGFLETIPGGIPLSHIDISITNCSFDGFAWYGALIQEIKKGKIIAGARDNGNTFNNIKSYASLGLWHNVNVKILVEGNTFFNPAGTRFGIEMYSSPYPDYLEQVPQTERTLCQIEQNVFNITGGTGGMLINDRRRHFYPDESPMLVLVKFNRFKMSDNALTGIGCFNMYGMLILNNRLEGSGQYGVRIMGPTPFPYNEKGMMIMNNFSNTVFSTATVLLDTRTRNWTLIGGNLGENIIDNGEDNIIKDMKLHHPGPHFGPFCIDEHEEMREAVPGFKDR